MGQRWYGPTDVPGITKRYRCPFVGTTKNDCTRVPETNVRRKRYVRRLGPIWNPTPLVSDPPWSDDLGRHTETSVF